ncbi:Zn(II)2Cys6 transcription factor [Aspergillus brunneoviolaceus CBS 621.78]|uniref:Uncharacterized protein n=1 Tax=Aspergillus brunneoviolaceus CBS 621.78 TaxID=1450534 RepID=A0ACD1G5Y2_9EURO|nr:hypothetical protein BO95DRAFT_444013 [Aspergillus brunneoviolaceus CBS 621.78]RAH44630.1 hypothetical protein BO95DRAFT_444013 [Aspergillus brunneoviolaceus CBS 621.78]
MSAPITRLPNTHRPRKSQQNQQQQILQRRKRAQVARACGNCRVRRIRCDNQVPCSNCALSRTVCSNSSAPVALTLSQAHQEIALLKQKVQQLEAELEGCTCSNRDNLTPDLDLTLREPPIEIQVKGPGSETHQNATPHPPWGGIHFRPARSSNSLWLGPSSLYSYIQRISGFLSLQLDQEQPAHQLLPISASDNKLLDRPTTDPMKSLNPLPNTTASVYLTPLQEDFFINYFWQTYHVSLFSIINEAHFKQHYASLWTAGGKERGPSALVDIVVAMCMQYHISTLPADSQSGLLDGQDALVAGRWHYWRGQTLLAYELESPSIATLQCHLLCAVYLCGGSFHNMMDSTVSLAVRTAYILGLHVDPPASLPEPDRELRRRLWWVVHLMDTRAGMKLGRPFMLPDRARQAMPQLPSDSLATAAASGSAFVPIGEDATWLSFNRYQTTLYIAIRNAYNALFTADLHLNEDQTIWDDAGALETGAQILAQHAPRVTEWAESVPRALRLQREGTGSDRAFTTSGTRLLLEPFTPPWLQRQRVLLELTYHHQCANLYRPAISFQCRPPPGGHAEGLARRCAAHAIAVSQISHQVMEETSLVNGWHEAFYMQWSAGMTLLGFLMIYHHGPMAPDARTAIGQAVAVFERFRAGFPVAGHASRILQGLLSQADLVARASAEVQQREEEGRGLGDGDPGSSASAFDAAWDLPQDLDVDWLYLAGDLDFWNQIELLWPKASDQLDLTTFEGGPSPV